MSAQPQREMASSKPKLIVTSGRRDFFLGGLFVATSGRVAWRTRFLAGSGGPTPMAAASFSRASCRVAVLAEWRSHFNQPPRPLAAWSETILPRQSRISSVRVTMDSSPRWPSFLPSHFSGAMEKVKPRAVLSAPTMIDWSSVSTQTASSASTSESSPQTSSARVSSLTASAGASGPRSRMDLRRVPSTHSVTMNGMPSTGSQSPKMTPRSAG